VRSGRAGRQSRKAGGKAVAAKKTPAASTPAASAASRPPAARTEAAPAAPARAGQGIGDLVCPACRQGHIIAGKRGWGCSRWRDGCKFVVWFEENGKRRSEADLREIVKSAQARA
jgi:DNA topoisomerase-3